MKPAGIGELLDRGVKLYRNHFVTAYLLMLIFFGPIYFMQQFLMFGMYGLTFMPQEGMTIAESFERFVETEAGAEFNHTGYAVGYLLFVFLVLPLFGLLLAPSAIASLLHLVRSEAIGERIDFGTLLKRSFKPYWRMVGHTALFGLIMVVTYFAVLIAGFLLMFIFLLGGGVLGAGLMEISSNPTGGGIVMIVLVIVAYIAFIFGVLAAFSYVLLRLGFYLPALALDPGVREHPLQRSWRLTKGSFWRLFAVLIVMSAIGFVIAVGGYALLIAVFKLSILGQIAYTLLMLLAMPLYILTFGAAYYEMMGRSEGSDIALAMAPAGLQHTWGEHRA